MNTPRIGRGSKGRVFLYIGVVMIVGITVVIIHETQSRMDDMRKTSEKCQQQQESLAAQLQVIFEYKTRLEKSVQQEKADHKKTHDDLSSQLETEKTKRTREVLDTTNKLASLQQHYKLLQGQHEDLAEECSGVRNGAIKALEEQRMAESHLRKLKEQTDAEIKIYKSQIAQLKIEKEKLSKVIKEDGNEVSNLQDENQRLENEINQCKKELASCPAKSSAGVAVPNFQSPSAASSSASPMDANGKDPLQNVLQQPDGSKAQSSSPTAGKSTAKSNVVPVPAPGPDAPKPLVGALDQLPAGVVPPGAVPKVQHDDYNSHDNFLQHNNQIAQPNLPFQNSFLRQPEQEEEDQKRAVGAAPPEQKMQWNRGNEIEEEDEHREAGMFQNYKEDGADRGAGHWNGGNHHLPDGERHEDLQLEDPDEDEGDDDVDQIDYGNDVVNNKNHNGKQKAHRKFPLGGKHDGVMVNPK
ncbi:Golgi integral membrane protein 4-like isoform X1 [Neocloeon triangulifer]|uniref:Golgi integral membrane protein 4-like isoform X1 n=1 Tax=Neocloeon triangulifer TaxID=2078957 RepID=UPI00286F97CD|nr:Golgi integral membrane protein 4-like isoform X1 [Neocloeon triangulifer]